MTASFHSSCTICVPSRATCEWMTTSSDPRGFTVPTSHSQAILHVQLTLVLDHLAKTVTESSKPLHHHCQSQSMLSLPRSPPMSSCTVSTSLISCTRFKGTRVPSHVFTTSHKAPTATPTHLITMTMATVTTVIASATGPGNVNRPVQPHNRRTPMPADTNGRELPTWRSLHFSH